jgi:hypothetical protein
MRPLRSEDEMLSEALPTVTSNDFLTGQDCHSQTSSDMTSMAAKINANLIHQRLILGRRRDAK